MLDVGRLPELIQMLGERGWGTTVMPVKTGMRRVGFGAAATHDADGWEVGMISPDGHDEITIGATLAEAVEAALVEVVDTGRGA